MISLDGRSLDLDDVAAVARRGERVRLMAAAARRVEANRRALEKSISEGAVAYGITTGFGELANVAIPEADVRKLQLNLLRSHAVGQGEPVRTDEVRASIFLRANTLALGRSGVRKVLVARLLDLLNRRVHPVIPSRGSLGASGDLAPLAHLGLVLVGEGRAEYRGRTFLGREALRRAGVAPLVLESKEGLAIINGTSVMAGGGGLAVHDGLRVLKGAQGAASIAFGALRGSPKPYDDRLVVLKTQPRGPGVAANMRRLPPRSESRPARLVASRLSDPPPFLTEKSGLNSGMMILQYVAAGYASDNKVLAHPASADSIPTSANQEDFVPMGMSAAWKAREAIENAAHVVAMEYLAAAQGLEFLQPLRPGVGPRAAYARIRGSIPRLVDDRSLAGDVDRILGWMKDGALVAAAEAASGGLA